MLVRSRPGPHVQPRQLGSYLLWKFSLVCRPLRWRADHCRGSEAPPELPPGQWRVCGGNSTEESKVRLREGPPQDKGSGQAAGPAPRQGSGTGAPLRHKVKLGGLAVSSPCRHPRALEEATPRGLAALAGGAEAGACLLLSPVSSVALCPFCPLCPAAVQPHQLLPDLRPPTLRVWW